jgi:hypothetical protein
VLISRIPMRQHYADTGLFDCFENRNILVRVAILVAFVALLTSVSAEAQTPGGSWGPWSRLTTARTGLESRVRCEYSTGPDSMWAFQIKNITTQTLDVVEREQYGPPDLRINKFGAPGLWTIGPGTTSPVLETSLHGTCAQVHDLKIDFVCVVPHGDTQACLHNSDGTAIALKTTTNGSSDQAKATTNVSGFGFCFVFFTGPTRVQGKPFYYFFSPVFPESNGEYNGPRFLLWFKNQPEYTRTASETGLTLFQNALCVHKDSVDEAQTVLSAQIEELKRDEEVVSTMNWHP